MIRLWFVKIVAMLNLGVLVYSTPELCLKGCGQTFFISNLKCILHLPIYFEHLPILPR